MKLFITRLFVLFLIAGNVWAANAQNLKDTVPFPPQVVTGTLPSGLKYVIHPNKHPAQKVEFRMVVNVGSIVETPEQRGMAHLLEHMAFNGSKEFPGDSIIQVLRTLGIKYGFDLNAYTGYNKTVYMLPVTTDKTENIDLGLKILYEWANNLSLLPQEIRDEKKVVFQEIKGFTAYDAFSEFKLAGSHYANKVAIGTVKQVKSITPEALKQFYDCWYRPDLITIVAVGDLNPARIEQKIKDKFKNYRARAAVITRPRYSLSTAGKTSIKEQKDSLLFGDKVQLIFPVKDPPVQTFEDQKNKLIKALFTRLINERLSKDTSVMCNYSNNWYLSNIGHAVFSFSANSNKKMLATIEKVAQNLACIKQFGIADKELQSIKNDYIKSINEDVLNYSSSFWCNNYIDWAITGDHYISNKLKKTFFQNQAGSITGADLQKEAELFFEKAQKRLITIYYNPKKSKPYKKNAIIRAWQEGLKSRPARYIFIPEKKEAGIDTIKSLKTGALLPGYVVKKKVYNNLGVTEIILKNGLRVALKPTRSTGKEIEIGLFGRGGLSTMPNNFYHYYESTAAYVDMGGAGQYSASLLSDLTSSLNITISTLIADYYHMLYGSALSGNLEELLKLFYLKITAPTKNYKDFDDAIANEVAAFGKTDLLLERLKRSPGRILQKKIAEYTGTIPVNKKQFESVDEIKALSLNRLYCFYHKLFDKTRDLTMVIAGNFDVNKAKKLVTKYMGALPADTLRNKCHFLGEEIPRGITRDTISNPKNPRPGIIYLMPGQYKSSIKETLIFKIMRDVIQNRLVKKLREEKGLVYSPFVTVNYTSYPRPAYCFQVEYSCDRRNITLLEKLLFNELYDLTRSNIPEEELDKIVKSFSVTKREALSPDNYSEWRKKLQEIYLEENSIQDFDKYDAILHSINTDDIRESFRQYINRDNFIVIQ